MISQLRGVTAITNKMPPGVVSTESGDSLKAQVGGCEICRQQAGPYSKDLSLILLAVLWGF